jgi:hypothetical protein
MKHLPSVHKALVQPPAPPKSKKNKIKPSTFRRAWWLIPIILALQRLRQEDQEFKASLGYTVPPQLGYMVRPCLENPNK